MKNLHHGLPYEAKQPQGLDVERLAEALEWCESQGFMALLGVDDRVDEKGYPLRFDYSGVENEVAGAILARLAATDPEAEA